MRSFKPFQILTLLVFFLLLCGFVAYRSGLFDQYLIKTANSQNSNLNGEIPLDTPTTLIDSQRSNPTLLPTSKSGVIFMERDNTIDQNNNSIEAEQKIQDSIQEVEKQKEINRVNIMSSSKSLIIFNPGLDSLQKFLIPKSDPNGVSSDTLEQKTKAP